MLHQGMNRNTHYVPLCIHKKIKICTVVQFCVITRYVDESVTTSAPLPISKRKHHLWPVG